MSPNQWEAFVYCKIDKKIGKINMNVIKMNACYNFEDDMQILGKENCHWFVSGLLGL